MNPATAANESSYATGVSRDFTLLDAADEYLEAAPEPVEDERLERWEREGRAEMYATLGLGMY